MNAFNQVIANIIISGAFFAILALGFNLLYRTVKFFDLAYGGMIVLGAYLMYFFTSLTIPIGLSALLSIVGTSAVGWGIYTLIYRKLQRKKASNLAFLIASLGISTVLQTVLAMLFSNRFQSLTTSYLGQTIELLGATLTRVQFYMIFVPIILIIFLSLLLKRTKTGKAIRATADDVEVTKVIGINTEKVTGFVYVISSAVAAIAGIFMIFDTGIEPTRGLPVLLKAVTVSIIGGIGNFGGGFIAAFLLSITENVGVWFLSGEWKEALAFSLLIIFLVFRPRGLLQK